MTEKIIRLYGNTAYSIELCLHYSNFFFSRRYNPWWVLACFTILFHILLSLHFSLQFLTFIFFRSSSIWSSHLSLGLPTGLDEHGSHSVSFLTVSDLYCSPNIVRVIKWRRVRWAVHVASMGERRGVYRVLVGKPEGK